MSWTVACFCGTVFESPAARCPTCGTPVPEVTRGEPEPDFVADLTRDADQTARPTAPRQ
jgi:hypothetical protein